MENIKTGIDISKWNGDINWHAVKAAGVDFAMIRIGTGGNHGVIKEDVNFATNIDGAMSVGIDVGVYLYSYALSVDAAKDEANNVIKLLKKYAVDITYPVCWDAEDSSMESLKKSTLTDMAKAWRDIVSNAGFIPGLYVNTKWLKSYIDLPEGMELWHAHWKSSTTAPEYRVRDDASIWQYSASGSVNGIRGDVDLDYCYVDYTKRDAVVEEKPAVQDQYKWREAISYLTTPDKDRNVRVNSPALWEAVCTGQVVVNPVNIQALFEKWHKDAYDADTYKKKASENMCAYLDAKNRIEQLLKAIENMINKQ